MSDLLGLVESRGIRMRRVGRKNGGEWAGGCPFCGDSGKPDSDRFHVWPQQRSNISEGTFWCRQCGKRGDTVNFIMQTSGISFAEACYRLNIPLPESKALRTPAPAGAERRADQPKMIEPPNALWRTKARAFVETAYNAIWDHPDVIDWLAARGIPESAVGRYGLGWNAKDYYRPRAVWGLPPELKEDGRERKLWLPPGLVIPQVEKGEIWRIRIRREGEAKPKYWAVPGSAMGCLVLGKGRVAVVIESELDTIAVAIAAGDVVTAVGLGSAQIRPDAATAALLRNSIDILFALDFDRAGAKELKWWHEHYPKSRSWPVPDGKDPGEAVKAGEDLRAWIMAGLPPAFHV